MVTANKRLIMCTAYAISQPEGLPVFADALSSLEENNRGLPTASLSAGSRAVLAQPSHVVHRAVFNPGGTNKMKRSFIHAVAALFLVLAAAPLFAVQRNAVDEVIRMTKAGVPVETMLDYIDKTDARIIVTGDDIIAMTDANVPKPVIKAVVDASASRRDSRDRGYSSSRVVVAAPYYYDPYYYYDPF